MEAGGSQVKLNGLYRSERKKLSYMKIEGDHVSFHEAGRADDKLRMEIKYGEFHELPENIADMRESTGLNSNKVVVVQRNYQNNGKKNFNIKIEIFWDKNLIFEFFGVFSDDQDKIYFKNDTTENSVDVHHKISKELADQIDADEGDPISGPPGPYTVQPDYQGRCLWISGPPGTGKSTTAQLLGRLHGYVYYEFDCFPRLKNPYIPLDVPNPSMMQDLQKHLTGEGKAERQQITANSSELWSKLIETDGNMEDEDFKELGKLYEAGCEDIQSERRRIGGDWAVAGCVTHRRIRDTIRSALGPECIFVLLTMSEEDLRDRIESRHSGQESFQSYLLKVAELCQTEEDEENVVTIKIDRSMTREDVGELILKETENYLKKTKN